MVIRWLLGAIVSFLFVVPMTCLATRILIWELEHDRLLFRYALSTSLSVAVWWSGYGLFVLIAPLRGAAAPGWVLGLVLGLSLAAPFLLFSAQTFRRLAAVKLPVVTQPNRRRLNPFGSRDVA